MSHKNREKLTERRPARDEEVKYVVYLLHFNHISCYTEGGLLLYIMSGEQRGNSTRGALSGISKRTHVWCLHEPPNTCAHMQHLNFIADTSKTEPPN